MIISDQETDAQARHSSSIPGDTLPIVATEEMTGAAPESPSESFELADLDRQPRVYVEQLQDKKLAEEVKSFLLEIRRAVMSLPSSMLQSRGLPPLHASSLEDGSVLIEWIFNDFRIGFHIDSLSRESSWHLVSTRNLDEINASGRISKSNLKTVLSDCLNFILLNS